MVTAIAMPVSLSNMRCRGERSSQRPTTSSSFFRVITMIVRTMPTAQAEPSSWLMNALRSMNRAGTVTTPPGPPSIPARARIMAASLIVSMMTKTSRMFDRSHHQRQFDSREARPPIYAVEIAGFVDVFWDILQLGEMGQHRK